MRIALLTLEAQANARAVRRFVDSHGDALAVVGLSNPYRPAAGGAFGQFARHLRTSGAGFVPYLALNFALPGLLDHVRRTGRGGVDGTPLAAACRARGISTTTIDDVNGEVFLSTLRGSGADLILTFHFDQILSAGTIAAARLGGINVHAGLLPLHRGPVPTLHALLDDPVRLGVTIHRLAPRIDAGAILAQLEMADEPGLTALGAAQRLHEAALPLLDRLLPAIADGQDLPEKNPPPLPYRGFPTAEELARLRRKGRRAAALSDLWR
jgi:methionyl-tRNA formyltransferase